MGLKPDKRAKGNWKTVALPLAIFAAELWSCLTKLSISQYSISLFYMTLNWLVVTSGSQLIAFPPPFCNSDTNIARADTDIQLFRHP